VKAEARKLYSPHREVINKPSRNQFPQAQKGKSIRLHRLVLALLYLSLFVVAGIYWFSQHQIVSAKQTELHKLQEEQKKLAVTEKTLDRQIKLLNNPDYIANYARDEYMFSKKGETIIIVPKSKEELEQNNK
jgi:cell division protein DivIC